MPSLNSRNQAEQSFIEVLAYGTQHIENVP